MRMECLLKKERKKGEWIGWINESVNEQWIDSMVVLWIDRMERSMG